MIWRWVLALTLGTVVFAYTPGAGELLSRMEAAHGRAEPVQVRVVREKPDGEVLEEIVLQLPGTAGSTSSAQPTLDLPYSALTLPAEDLLQLFPTLAAEGSSVDLGRLNGKVCYILKGSQERMWIDKGDLLPLKIEDLSGKRLGSTYLYLDLVNLSEKVLYPSRTEVWRDGDLILVERLLPASASSTGP